MKWAETSSKQSRRLKVAGLVAGLVVLVIVAAAFIVSVVQIQAAITGYVGGNGAWSRAQVNTVWHLDKYARTGMPRELEAAKRWIDIPLGDMSARLAMEAESLDLQQARAGLIRGWNHPDDLSRMIWLFRHFSELKHFQSAIDAWRETDPHLIELQNILRFLEDQWQTGAPDEERISQLRARLEEVNASLDELARQFRRSMGKAARWTTTILSITSIVFLVLLSALAWALVQRLVQIRRAHELKFRAIFEQTAVGIAQVQQDGRILDVNQAACEILNRPRSELIDLPFFHLVHPEDWKLGRDERLDLLEGRRQSATTEYRLLKGSNDLLWARITASMIWKQAGTSPYMIAMLEDISESRRLASELSFQATHDELTGLFNRREFERQLASTLGRARNDGSVHALCFIDLDQFKVVNDTSGHSAGDQLLRQVAQLVRSTLRDHDILARLGGDEFGVILENCDLEQATVVAEKLRRALETIVFSWEGDNHSIGCSIGVVPITTEAPDIGELMRAADIACYVAKNEGRNRVYASAHNDQLQLAHRGEMAWLNRIQEALHENRFYLDAQLIVPASDAGDLPRYEVLIRLTNTDGEVVPPSAFLPAAERYGVISKIDRWVITEAIRKLAQHPEHLDSIEACHINLSGRSFDQSDFADFVIGQIREHKVPANRLCFEITETAAVHNLVDVQTFMVRLAKMGCSFALDDFGTGLSSFSYLRQLPVDCLKIDGAFVRHISSDDSDRAMVRAIHDIGHTLHKCTIAEFVENDEAADILREIGVDYLQGFGLHRPCRFDDLLKQDLSRDPKTKPRPRNRRWLRH
ncbi:EAL domain-containing protein [Marinobacter nanhaiticus D15-8W]|uniref:GGDEF domain-containing protein n=1 Tax=Marinobacter nanhaiticus D15-8W TaxID=626887 RepID=N6WVX6_9GAMM|nr:EAL domain-containing protein [Marinobacter nanhaiticus]ENO12998.1 GGDEF domain-containing protein [Marinobacter nanhaiticus D15-8W]BES70352.1 EAL domain-containing protein [Marinobacter nanhaiticus D15-8W]